MKTRISMVGAGVWLSAVVGLTACAPQISAQGRGAQPSPQECRTLANQLRSTPRSEAFRHALRSNVAACGDVGAEAIATALRAAKGVREPGYADRFQFIVAYNRSPLVLDALLDVAEDLSAAPAMRIMAIGGALRQHTLGSVFGESPDELALHPMGRICDFEILDHAGEYRSAAPLPANYRQTIASRLRRIADDPASPAGVRDAARCTADRVWP